MRQRATRCEVCKEVLFTGISDPFQHYIGSLEIPPTLEPVAVCMGPTFLGRWWRRRKWYHQSCCGISVDTKNRAGEWYVFTGRCFSGVHKWEIEDDERAIRRADGGIHCVHCGAERLRPSQESPP